MLLPNAMLAERMRPILQSIACCLAILLVGAPRVFAQTTNLSNLAQAPIIRSWGTEAGLPQNTVNAIVQTRDGYMWLGTHDGLARFDGVRFKVFGLENGLPSVDILSLFVDHQDTLWIGTYGGGLCYLRQGQIQTVTDLPPICLPWASRSRP